MGRLLVTGGAGFIGSNFIRYWLSDNRRGKIVNLDALTYAGNLENLKDITDDPRYDFVKGDIRDRQLVEQVVFDYGVDRIINFAAESHVDRSIEEPGVFWTTNVLGTQVLIEAARENWKEKPDDKYDRAYQEGVTFVQVSTDEVYGDLGDEGSFHEDLPLLPNSPYAASKASADLLIRSYHQTFGMPVNITRCSNNYGPYQFLEKLIPLMIQNSLDDKPLPVYGDGQQIRDWLHVKDHCRALCLVLAEGRKGEIYNIGGQNEKTNLDMVRFILKALDKPASLIQHVRDRPGHDRRYAVDTTKIQKELGFSPAYTLEEGLMDTIRWYQSNQKWAKRVASGDYQAYYQRMYGKSK